MALSIFSLMGSIFVDSSAAEESIKKTEEKSGKLSESLASGIATAGKWAAGIATAAAGVATAIGGAFVAAAESTRDYRNEMSKLETAFQTAGHTSEAAKATYGELNAVLGDSGQAVEAANHLAQLCETEEELQKWTDICTGVYATFGDSIPIEGLTEAANETAKVGTLTGGLADALNWAGVNEEEFQASLDKCNTEQERQALITETLTGLYDEASDTYKEANADIIEANKAQENMNATMAEIGAIAEPVITLFKNMFAEMLMKYMPTIQQMAEKLLPLLMNTVDAILPAIVSLLDLLLPLAIQIVEMILPVLIDLLDTLLPPLIEIIKTVLPVLMTLLKPIIALLPSLFKLITPIIDACMGVIVPLVELLDDVLPPLIEIITFLIGTVLETLRATFQNVAEVISNVVNVAVTFVRNQIEILKNAFNSVIDFIRNVFIGSWKSLIENVKEIISNVLNTIIDFIRTFVENWKAAFENAKTAISNILNTIVGFVKNFIENWKASFENAKTIISNIFNNIIDFVKNVFTGKWSSAFENVKNILSNIFQGMISVVKSPVNAIIGVINGLVSGVTSGINAVIGVLNKLNIDVPDWVTKKTGITSLGFNISKISAPQIPYLAEGGNITEEGSAIVGERGAELIDLPQGAKVTPLTQNNDPIGYKAMTEKLDTMIALLAAILEKEGSFRIGETEFVNYINKSLGALI